MSEETTHRGYGFNKHESDNIYQLLAIALKYVRNSEEPPRVIAKGRDELARKILELAIDNQIHVVNNAVLAKVLSYIELDEYIPAELYSTVAEIITAIYAHEHGKN